MRKRDRANLEFILSIPNKRELNKWWDSISDDDRKYALELLHCYKLNLIDRAVELQPDYSQAKEVIDRIKAKV